MSTLADQIRAERALAGTPRITAVSAEYREAVSLALTHARARLHLPTALPIVWHAAPGGNEGEAWQFRDGSAEIHLNAGLDNSPRRVAWTVLHECKHVHDGQHHGMSAQEAEDGANHFAFDVMERQTRDFERLSWRRPSGRR